MKKGLQMLRSHGFAFLQQGKQLRYPGPHLVDARFRSESLPPLLLILPRIPAASAFKERRVPGWERKGAVLF